MLQPPLPVKELFFSEWDCKIWLDIYRTSQAERSSDCAKYCAALEGLGGWMDGWMGGGKEDEIRERNAELFL